MLMNSNHGLNCRNWCWIPLNILLVCFYWKKLWIWYESSWKSSICCLYCLLIKIRGCSDFSYVLFINAPWVWHMEVFTHRDRGSGESSARCVNQHAQCTSNITEESEFYGAKTNCFVSVGLLAGFEVFSFTPTRFGTSQTSGMSKWLELYVRSSFTLSVYGWA